MATVERILADHVLVRVHKGEIRYKGRIIIPDNAPAAQILHSKENRIGEVVMTGPGRVHPKTGFRMPMSVKPGWHVVFSKLRGLEVVHNGEKLLLIKEGDIMGRWEADDNAPA